MTSPCSWGLSVWSPASGKLDVMGPRVYSRNPILLLVVLVLELLEWGQRGAKEEGASGWIGVAWR